MNIYDLNEIYEMLKRNGYVEKEDNISSNIPDIDPSGGADSNCCANVNLDIPGGFQDIDPIVFLTIGELIGNIIAGNVPFNVAVAISNWLNLVGQAIETYGAQQQYFQNGPGRYYNLRDKNVNNPFCSCTSKASADDLNENSKQNSNSDCNVNENVENSSKDNNINSCERLENIMEELKEQIEKLKTRVSFLEKTLVDNMNP